MGKAGPGGRLPRTGERDDPKPQDETEARIAERWPQARPPCGLAQREPPRAMKPGFFWSGICARSSLEGSRAPS